MKNENDLSKDAVESFLKTILDKRPTIILRKDLSNLTDGVLNGRTIANDDSKGVGIPGRFKIGNRAAYPTTEVINYIKNKIRVGE